MIRPILAALMLATGLPAALAAELEYAPAPVDNPLKGLVPYMGDRGDEFPHTMEFFYLPVSAVVVGEGEYDWIPLEQRLGKINARGHQAIFRFYLEYPKKPTGVPEYLRDGSLDTDGFPDYSNDALRRCLIDFIAAFGGKFDRNPGIGFITAGLLGKWGEWHTFPDDDRWASRELQDEVMDAFEMAFKATPVLLRYPHGDDDARYVANAGRGLGYHDDSFAWGTIGTDGDTDFWHFMPLLTKAGDAALSKWKTHPIGGEIRPEAWGQCFDPEPANPRVQDFDDCVRATHVSWLMDSGMFDAKHRTPERLARAKESVRGMGYEYHVPRAEWKLDGDAIQLSFEIENRGVAPFYGWWELEAALVDAEGAFVSKLEAAKDVRGILPGSPRSYELTLGKGTAKGGDYRIVIGVPNPIEAGPPLCFANEEQDRDVPGWLTLGKVSL